MFKNIFAFFREPVKKSDYATELNQYQYALDQSAIIAITDQYGIITYVNDNFCKISKYTKQELIGQNHRLINSGYHTKAFFGSLWAGIQKGQIWKGELRNKAKDGSYYWVDTTIVPFVDSYGKPYQYLAIHTDITDKKNIEEKQDLYEQIIQFSDDAIISKDLEGRITSWNKGAEEIFGYKKHEVLKKHISLIIPAERMDEETHFMANIRADRHIAHFETERIKKDGIRIHVSITLSPIKDSEGNIVGASKILRDITAKKINDKALIESETRFRNTLDKMLEGVQIIDFDWRYIYVNDAMAKHGKYERDAFIGKTVMEMYPGIEETETFQVYKQCFDERVPVHLENFFLFPDGSKGWFELSFQPIPEGIFILSIDITERKRAEEALIRNEWVYRSIASSIPDSLICILDKNLRYTLLEGDLIEKIGYTKNALLGQRIPDVVDDTRYKQLLPQLERVFAGETFTAEDKREAGMYTLSKFVPFTDRNGQIDSVMIAVLDITRLKQAQEKILELNHELEAKVKERTIQLAEANKELESFSYSVSHDLRAPLRGIDGWSLALLEDYGSGLDENANKYLQRIRLETQRMGMLIDDLLKLTQVSRTEIRLVPVNLSKIAKAITERLTETQPERKFSLNIANDLVVVGDHGLLDIMLTNLLSNAWKFSGKQVISEIEFGKKEDSGETVYFIKDNGVGFDMANAKKLFGAFQRMHRQSEFSGTGIGLAIVHRIIHLHKGEIWAESFINQGTTFYFTIPSSKL